MIQAEWTESMRDTDWRWERTFVKEQHASVSKGQSVNEGKNW